MTDRLTEEQMETIVERNRKWAGNVDCCARCDAARAFLQSRQDAEVAKARLDLARQALILDGYFEEREIGLDIAPRIAELSTALRAKLAESERAREHALGPKLGACTVCWTESWEPVPADDPDAEEVVKGVMKGSFVRCTMCLYTAALASAQKRVKELECAARATLPFAESAARTMHVVLESGYEHREAAAKAAANLRALLSPPKKEQG